MTPGAQAPLDPGIGELLSKQAGDAARQQEEAGLPACLLVPDRIRAQLARLLKRGAPRLRVLAHSEIPETHSIRINRVIGAAVMNVKRFVGKNTREAMAQVRAAYGEEAVLLSNRAVPGGVEILAMPSADVPTHPIGARPAGLAPTPADASMSTLSFQEFVRERARKRAAEVAGEASQPIKEPMAETPSMSGRSLPDAVQPGRERLASVISVQSHLCRRNQRDLLRRNWPPSCLAWQ